MNEQHLPWSRVAAKYEKEFVNPYLPQVQSPLLKTLRLLARRGDTIVADLGCGVGPLLPFLSKRFTHVWAVDFAEGMLDRARATAMGAANISFLRRDFTDLAPLYDKLDVAVAVNSLVMPDLRDLDRSLREIHACLRPDGWLVGILPAMDAVHYLTLLYQERALALGQPLDAARKHAAYHNDHGCYDFAFSEFRYEGLEQHFWQPFEVRPRLERAGFQLRQLKKVRLAWKQFACYRDLEQHPAPWDWFFLAQRSALATG